MPQIGEAVSRKLTAVKLKTWSITGSSARQRLPNDVLTPDFVAASGALFRRRIGGCGVVLAASASYWRHRRALGATAWL